MAARPVLGALVLTLPQLRGLMNYATVAVSVVLSVPEPAFPLSYLSPTGGGSVHIPVVCLRHA